MATLNKLAKDSALMDFDITYAGKRYRFNLYEECQIVETKLNNQLKSHPSSYSFLTQLRTYLIFELDTLEGSKEDTYNRVYAMYKGKKNEGTGRLYSDDLAKAKALSSKQYRKVIDRLIKIKFQKNTLDNAVKAFETRGYLLQTLSANVRNER